ncbi:exosome complex component RRP41 [Enteropsectra breve]|nr:exosome complex component RRP41 [Enteropsectra breve]
MAQSMVRSIRNDGRMAEEFRKINIQQGVANNNGFVELQQGCTLVTCSILPSQEKSPLTIDIKFNEATRIKSVSERRIYELKNILADVFGQIFCSKNSLVIEIEVKQEDGGLLACLINCVSLCMVSYGIPIIDFCVSVAFNEKIDLNSAESSKEASMTIAYLPNLNKILYLKLEGGCQHGRFNSALGLGIVAAKNLHQYFVASLKSDEHGAVQ